MATFCRRADMDCKTERLRIRDWVPEQDAKAAIAIYGDRRVTQWIGDKSLDQTVTAVQARLERYRDRAAVFPGLGCWAVVTQATEHVIGTLLLMPLPDRNNRPSGQVEIGWHFAPASWGQGYATEAAQAGLHYGFTVLQLAAIDAVMLPLNQRSLRVAQRLGMEDLGISEDYYGGYPLRLLRRQAPATLTAPDPATPWQSP